MTYKECPCCHEVYETALERQHPEMLIQQEFPDVPAWQREQHISGLCSNRCWNRFLFGIDSDKEIRGPPCV